MAQPEAGKAIEAILMVAQEPVDPHLLAQLLEIAPAAVEALCSQLQASYAADDRGFVLVKVAGGYRFQSHGDLAPYVERFVLEGQSARLSSAALETLAIVAYKQPLSRAQVSAIRGVNVDGVMRTLQQRGYIVETGRDPGPGQATMFGTSQEFLERLGLDSLDDLPPIADLFPSAEVMEALERGLRSDAGDRLPLDATESSEQPEPETGSDAAAETRSLTETSAVPDDGVAPAPPEPAPAGDRVVDDLSPPSWALDGSSDDHDPAATDTVDAAPGEDADEALTEADLPTEADPPSQDR